MKNRASAVAARLYLAQQYLTDTSTPDSIAQCQGLVILYHNREMRMMVMVRNLEVKNKMLYSESNQVTSQRENVLHECHHMLIDCTHKDFNLIGIRFS